MAETLVYFEPCKAGKDETCMHPEQPVHFRKMRGDWKAALSQDVGIPLPAVRNECGIAAGLRGSRASRGAAPCIDSMSLETVRERQIAQIMTSENPMPDTSEFDRYYDGLLYSVMRWDQLTAFWDKVDAEAGWYLYAVGQAVPTSPAPAGKVEQFMRELDELLRREHHEDYCAIVYADDLEQPNFIKIYDPGHLGSSCGSSATKTSVLPGWLMSKTLPRELESRAPVTGQRKRWWQAFLGSPA